MATAVFPTNYIANADVGGPVVNRQQLTQSGTITNVDATITATVAIPASWPTSGRVVMQSEVIWYGGKSGSTLTSCLRGQENTTAAGHTGVAIEMDFTAEQFNQILVDLIAVQTKVGKTSDATTSTHDYKLSGVTGSDKAVSKTGAEVLTNKTLTSPVLNGPTIGTDITLSSAATKFIAGATSVSFRDNANAADNLLIANNGDITVRGIITGVTTLTATTLAGTLSTAAQANVTALGTLTSLTISGLLTMTAAASQIRPGATSFAVRDTANARNNLLLIDAGDMTLFRNFIFATAAGKVIPGATSLTFRNNADGADNIAILDNGNITLRGTLSGITTLTATTLAGTLSTAAQPNVTSVGTLTSLTLGGNLTFTPATSQIIPGSTQFIFRDNANANNNVIIADNGDVSVRARILMLTAVSKFIPGATSWALRNNADSANNMLINDNGSTDFRSQYVTLGNAIGSVGGGTQDVDWNLGNVATITLTGNETLTFSNPRGRGRYALIVTNSGAARTITWPATVKWSAGGIPVPSGSGKVDTYGFFWDGTNYYGSSSLNY